MKSLLYHLIRTWAFPLPSKNFWQLITMGSLWGGGEDLPPSHFAENTIFEGVANEHSGYAMVENKERCLSPFNSSLLFLHPKLTILWTNDICSHPCPGIALPPKAHSEGERAHRQEGGSALDSRLCQLHDHEHPPLWASVSSTGKWCSWTRIMNSI